MTGQVLAVHASGDHTFSKASQSRIRLLLGLRVEGDAHVAAGGDVRPGDEIRVELPAEPHRALEPV